MLPMLSAASRLEREQEEGHGMPLSLIVLVHRELTEQRDGQGIGAESNILSIQLILLCGALPERPQSQQKGQQILTAPFLEAPPIFSCFYTPK
jgi:hypothetical protein